MSDPELSFANGAPLSSALRQQLTAYHSDQWLQSLCQYYGYRPVCETVSVNDRVSALASLVAIRNLSGRKLCSPPASMYGYLLAESDGALQKLVENLQQRATENRQNLLLKLPAETLRGMYLKASEVDARIPLSDEDTAWSTLRSAARRAVRKSQSLNVQVKLVPNERLDEYFPMLVKTRRRLRLPVAPRTWLATLLKKNLARLMIAYRGEEPMAGVLFVTDALQLHYALPAYTDEGARCRAMDACLWELILTGIREDRQWLCLGGSAKENEGLRRFKQKWGAKERDMNLFSSDRPSHAPWIDFKQGNALLTILPTRVLEFLGYTYLRYMQ